MILLKSIKIIKIFMNFKIFLFRLLNFKLFLLLRIFIIYIYIFLF